jgi:hypothetical protein
MPAEVTLRIRLEPEHALDHELEVVARELAVRDALDEHLRRHDQEHADDRGHQQAQRALAHQRRAAATLQREPHARPGDDEQQRHAQAVRDVHGHLQRRDRLGIRDVPAPADEQHAGMEKQQHEDGEDAQPIEEFVAFGLHGAPWLRGASAGTRGAAIRMGRTETGPGRAGR